jgi:eukaryotic-like serine/threonine-protein kinase
MPLQQGTKLGPYEVVSALGAGGMGEVYRARDTRLKREVALKILPREVSYDPERRERFEQEARAVAALNHPNIVAIYDIGSEGDILYIVTELVDGEPLSGMKLNLRRTLDTAVQIADGLAAAHAAGVTHRDLKPDNVMVTADGRAKILDFGLAKVTRPIPADETTMKELTEPGAVMGTIGYMSPEQVQGQAADYRADIFSFGVILYELLGGRRAFHRETAVETMWAILKEDPPELPESIPSAVRQVVSHCLEKEPKNRFQSARDLSFALSAISQSSGGTGIQSSVAAALPGPSPRRKGAVIAVAASAAAATIVAGATLALWAPWRKPIPTQAVRFEIGPAAKMTFIDQAAMAASPDGRWMVFPARGEDGIQHYYIRALDGVEVRVLPGADGGQSPAAWSYDSRWVLFVTGGRLKKVDIQGGPPQNLTDFPTVARLGGADWNPDGAIVAGADGSPILQVPAAGGQLTPVTVLAPGDSAHRWPQFLPDGKHFLYQRISSDAAKTGVYIASLDARPNDQSMRRLLATDRQAYYAAAPGGGRGHLIFLRGATLMAQPFDPNKMTLSGEPGAIAFGVDSYTLSNHGLFSVSNTGTLVYRGGAGSQAVLTWFDQRGNPAGTLGDLGEYSFPAISPDGSRVAVAMGPQESRDIWILDVARGSSTRFTFDPASDETPAWSPDGKNIAFSSTRGGQAGLYIKPADGSGEERLLLKTDEPKQVERWTKDGRFLLFTSAGPKTSLDTWALPFPGEAKPVSLLQTRSEESRARVSPDGRWLAYRSTESGASEVYVRPFTPQAPAGTGAKWLVSKGGGSGPIWRPDGKELFYLAPASQAMAVDVDTSKGFQAGTPRRMFTAQSGVVNTTGWDLSPDGKRFLLVAPPNAGRIVPFTVVLNWAAGLRK